MRSEPENTLGHFHGRSLLLTSERRAGKNVV
ncbi:hypothetical protein NK6_4472 [Bradyrhizobium diazoefficiens]|uniref:Uncharacterized protein n=1 Tax=Bradyrhizobium diazoefficiens TaxID=1355477 RepID=A0A0E3VUL9_9BRAD|nr:hypothetical protein NK6_4472 [Bradyrhizobium diazoefficiens]